MPSAIRSASVENKGVQQMKFAVRGGDAGPLKAVFEPAGFLSRERYVRTLWISVRGFSSAAGVSGARLPADVEGVAAQSEMPNRTPFSDVPAAHVPRFGDSGRIEVAKLVGTNQESRSMSRSS